MTVTVSLRWITPDAQRQIVDIARVSSDPSKPKVPDAQLLGYLIRNKHWSPFEMASACVEIVGASRAITRQILRHRAFHFQEFSQRYQSVNVLQDASPTETRLQHPTNRQASVAVSDVELEGWWVEAQQQMADLANTIYQQALSKGIAKEQARAVLPEGLTPTRMMMSGTIRDWLHYCGLRLGNGTQPEHRDIAHAIWDVLRCEIPMIARAYLPEPQLGFFDPAPPTEGSSA